MSRLTRSSRLALKSLSAMKMPGFTLYGSRGSTNTDRVRLTLAEGGYTDYKLVLLNLQKGEQKMSTLLSFRKFVGNRCAVSICEQVAYPPKPRKTPACLLNISI